jgi:hypothetical protein
MSRSFSLGAFLVLLAAFAWIGQTRLVDGDEGFYLMTSHLVMQGKLPYHDFLLTQMPLLPYVAGIWMWLAGMTWTSARILPAILASALGALLVDQVCRQTKKRSAGIAAGILFVSSTHVFAWFTTVKTYGLSTLLLFLAYRTVVRRAPASPLTWALAGLCLGLSADARLYFIAVFPAFLWWIFKRCAPQARLAAALWFCAGVALALAPNLYLFAKGPENWYFDNVGFHSIRSGFGLIGAFRGKLWLLSWLLLGGGDGNGMQMLLICFSLLVLAKRPLRKPGSPSRSARFWRSSVSCPHRPSFSTFA